MQNVTHAAARRLLFVVAMLVHQATALAQVGLDVSVIPPAAFPAASPDAAAAILVTGSRIPAADPSAPVEIIRRDEMRLAGARSLSDVLQAPAVTSGGAQVNDSFLGYVTAGGPGADTVGLRGLGADRTLVLLNGRRLSPAGSQSQLGSADLNTLPLSIVDHVEILKDGASTIYGSDAIAGVINIITHAQTGLTLDGYGNLPLHRGDGSHHRLSGSYGLTSARGRFAIAIDYDVQDRLQRKDRADARCPTDDLVDPQTGAFLGATQGGQPRCLPITTGGQGVAQDYLIAYGFGGTHRYAPDPAQTADAAGDLAGYALVDSVDARPGASAVQQQEDIYSPVRTLSVFASGARDIGGTRDVQFYGEALFSRRLSSQTGTQQLNAVQDGIYPGYLPGLFDYPLFPRALSEAGYFVADPLFILGPARTSQRVDYLRADGGVRGDVGIGDWRFDANAMFAHSRARYTLVGTPTSRLRDSIQLVAAPAGTPAALTVTGGGDRVIAGSYTCAANVANGALIADPACVPIDWYAPGLLAGDVPSALRDWLQTPITGHTGYTQITGEIGIDGSLLRLPAGPLGFAIGASLRHDRLNDVPSAAAQAGDVYNNSSAGITRGSDLVGEVYGELRVPILRDRPLFRELSAIASGRYTHYRSYGAGTTWKVSATWAPAAIVRFRASYGTSFRAPSLYQLDVAEQTGFYGAELDPCADYQEQAAPGGNRARNCATALAGTAGAAQAVFNPSAGPEAIARGGKGLLKAETSTALGYGMVIEPGTAGLSLTLDYYRIAVHNEITRLGVNVLNYCYDSPDFAADFYCGLIAPRDATTGDLTSFTDPFVNIARQSTSGVDIGLRAARAIGAGRLTATLQATRVLSQRYQPAPGGTVYELNGTLGTADFAGGPKWTGALALRYDRGGWTVRYGLDYVGAMDGDALQRVDPATDPYDYRTGAYLKHGLALRYAARDGIAVTLGMQNFTDARPKVVSVGASVPRLGNAFNYSGYDFIGRSLFLEVSKNL